MAERGKPFPQSYNVMTMIDEADKYLKELLPPEEQDNAPFRTEYDFASEFVHPSMGSFAVYQRFIDGRFEYDRSVALTENTVHGVLSNLRMSSYTLIQNAEKLAGMTDLPNSWPGDIWLPPES